MRRISEYLQGTIKMHMQVQDVSDLMTNKMLALKRELNIYMTLRQSDPAKVM